MRKKRKIIAKFFLTMAHISDRMTQQNEEGWLHPPHPQQSEGVKMVTSVPTEGRIVLCGCLVHSHFLFCIASVLPEKIEGGASVLAV